jgi:hypothetical protein
MISVPSSIGRRSAVTSLLDPAGDRVDPGWTPAPRQGTTWTTRNRQDSCGSSARNWLWTPWVASQKNRAVAGDPRRCAPPRCVYTTGRTRPGPPATAVALKVVACSGASHPPATLRKRVILKTAHQAVATARRDPCTKAAPGTITVFFARLRSATTDAKKFVEGSALTTGSSAAHPNRLSNQQSDDADRACRGAR